jgi:two-component system, sensor histidine kinase and response regulator
VFDHHLPELDGIELARLCRQDERLRNLPTVLLSSGNAPEEAERLAAAGIQAQLSRPLRQSTLYDTVVELVVGESSVRHHAERPSEAAMSARPLRGRLLLAEDNLVNQEVATSMLETLGCEVKVASNGEEAIHDCQREAFDLVLMDCQMPGMDGFEATRAIRRWEQVTGRHIPIVALTANAMQGDREQCLAAGMDDYLSKPFDLGQLRAIAGKMAARTQRPGPAQTAPGQEPGPTPARNRPPGTCWTPR